MFPRGRWKPLVAVGCCVMSLGKPSCDCWFVCDVMTHLGSLFRVLTASGVKVLQ